MLPTLGGASFTIDAIHYVQYFTELPMKDKPSIFELISDFKEEFRVLLLDALQEGLTLIGQAVETKKYIGHYYNWPRLSYSKNGLPSFSINMQGPIQYTDCFTARGEIEPLVVEDNIASFNNFIAYVEDRSDLRERFCLREWKDNERENEFLADIDKFFIKSPIKDAIERYAHKYQSFQYEEAKGKETIAPIVNYIFNKKLSIDIIIPILFLDFGLDKFILNDGVEIVRIENQLHLSRYNIKSYNISVHECVLASATHALVLKNWSVPNAETLLRFDILTNPRAYPIDLIEKFFGVLRIATGVNTGYAQLLASPIEWGTLHCKADLPDLVGATIRSYPSWFENYYWNTDSVPIVSMSDTELIKDLFIKLAECKENSINIAIKRLNTCLVRDTEEDSILDATIALEALFSDGGNQEMTHKLAMRVAALSKLTDEFKNEPKQVFKDIKGIYSYRSAIVHGSKQLDKKRVIKIKEEQTSAHSIAIEYLRLSLKTLLQHPEYRDPIIIDDKLLLTK